MIIKDLILGKYSLAKTFWLFGILGSFILGAIGIITIQSNIYIFYVSMVLVVFQFIYGLITVKLMS